LAVDAITNAKVADDAIQSENIKDGEVKTGDLADDAVTEAKIKDDDLHIDKLADVDTSTTPAVQNDILV
jgi:hypothetical protein